MENVVVIDSYDNFMYNKNKCMARKKTNKYEQCSIKKKIGDYCGVHMKMLNNRIDEPLKPKDMLIITAEHIFKNNKYKKHSKKNIENSLKHYKIYKKGEKKEKMFERLVNFYSLINRIDKKTVLKIQII